jgi:hypothetical protein
VITTTRASGRRRRLALLAALSLLASMFVQLLSQTAAHATITVSTFAGTGTAGFSGDGGAATGAKLNQPQAVTTDGLGNVYIFDWANKRVRKVDTSGNIQTLKGTGVCTWDTSLTNADTPDGSSICTNGLGFAAEPNGNLWLNNGGVLDYMYSAFGGTLEHKAGKVTGSYAPGPGDGFNVNVAPTSLVANTYVQSGNPFAPPVGYFIEPAAGSNANHAIYSWTPTTTADFKMTTTVSVAAGKTASCSGYANTGAAAVGACLWPSYLAQSGKYLYFFDTQAASSGPRIFRVDVTESPMLLHLVAGNGCRCDSSGVAVSSGISSTGPLAVASNGDVYLASTGHGVIRKVTTAGYLSDVVNVGGPVSGMAFDSADNLYAAVPGSNKVVKVSGLGSASTGQKLVTLGDSVAAGEGINYGWQWDGQYWNSQYGTATPAWVDTTPATGYNYQACHQSNYAYSRFLYSKYTVYNMACTGASTMSGMLNGYTLTDPDNGNTTSALQELGWGGDTSLCSGCAAPSWQFDQHNPDVVLLTLGADDVHFGDWLGTCYGGTTACDTTDNTSQLNSDLSTQASNLRLDLTELNRWAGSKGKVLRVLVTNYFDPFQSTYAQCVDTSGAPLLTTYPWIGITQGEQTWIKNGLISLNGNINSEVSYANSNDSNLNASLVDISTAAAGHEFCTSDPWVYGPSIKYPAIGGGPGNSPAPFHPTPPLQQAIYQKVKTVLGI